jgi:HK97 family phage prohead protease
MTRSNFKSTTALVHRRATLTEANDGVWECALSSERPGADRYGDIILQGGIRRENFKKTGSPVLFNHESSQPIGILKNDRIEGGQLRGEIHLAPKSASPRMAEMHALIECGALRSVSIGFLPIESSPLPGGKGRLYSAVELVELSVVATPCNVDALMSAKSYGVSGEMIRKIFKMNNNNNASLSERIAEAKAARARGEAALARAEAMLQGHRTKPKSKTKPLLLTASTEAKKKAGQMSYNQKVAEDVKARVKRYRQEEYELKKDKPVAKPHTWNGESYTTVTWRGHEVKVLKWKGEDV